MSAQQLELGGVDLIAGSAERSEFRYVLGIVAQPLNQPSALLQDLVLYFLDEPGFIGYVSFAV